MPRVGVACRVYRVRKKEREGEENAAQRQQPDDDDDGELDTFLGGRKAGSNNTRNI